MKQKPLPTLSRLKELIECDGDVGILMWKPRPRSMFKSNAAYAMWNSRYAGNEAGGFDALGYRRIVIDYVSYKSHRIIWLMTYGAEPEYDIDHINHVRSDNRVCNLRDVSALENARNMSLFVNNKSGCAGVYYSKRYRKWKATIKVDGEPTHLGTFDSKADAIKARKAAEVTYGYHENCGLVV